MDNESKNKLYLELLEENKKLISYASKIFCSRNRDSSLSANDFKQDAKILLWDCFDSAKIVDKINIHRLWKCCLFRHINNCIRKQMSLKRFGGKKLDINMVDSIKSIDGAFIDEACFKISDLHKISTENIEISNNDFNRYVNDICGSFVEKVKERFGEKSLKYKVMKIVSEKSEDFELFVKKESKKDIYTFRQVYLAKYLDVTPASITLAIKSLKEYFEEWNQEMKSLTLTSQEKEN